MANLTWRWSSAAKSFFSLRHKPSPKDLGAPTCILSLSFLAVIKSNRAALFNNNKS